MGEQTWPSEEEMNQNNNDLADGRNRRSAPSNVCLNFFVLILIY